jgi:hypothetical protein
LLDIILDDSSPEFHLRCFFPSRICELRPDLKPIMWTIPCWDVWKSEITIKIDLGISHHTIFNMNKLIFLNYRWISLYAIDRDQKIWLAYNKFAYKKTKGDCKLGDTFQKNGQFAIAGTRICI